MIDEKKLIEEIKSLHVTVNGLRAGKGILREFEKQYRESILRIIEEQPKVGEWIPCSDRLPEEPLFEKGYIVQSEYIKEPFSAYWDGENWTDVYDEEIEVIAWQPLPKPFQKG